MFNIALNTFREIVRNKFLYLILFFSFIFILFSVSLGKLSLWEDSKIIIDFGLAMIEFFGLIWVLFVWSQLLFNEVNWKTIFLILSKPIKRYEFILWKFFWFSLVILLLVIFESLVFSSVLLFKSVALTKLIWFSLIFILLKLEVLLALVLFFSTFMSNILTILVTVFIYFISHWFTIILDLATRTRNEFIINSVKWVDLLFPPFEAMNLKDMIGWIVWVTNTYLLSNLAYALWYLTIILFFTVILFNRKTFER
jgi:ABC-type transport system involved in multi-copper enzyme maturation permease subunit